MVFWFSQGGTIAQPIHAISTDISTFLWITAQFWTNNARTPITPCASYVDLANPPAIRYRTRVNILFIANAYPPAISGVSLSAARFKTSLEELGHTVLVIAPRYPGHTETDPNIIRVATLPNPFYPEYPIARFRVTPALLARLHREHIQLVHTMQPFTVGRFARSLARRLQIPLVFTHHARYDLYAHYVPLMPKAFAARQVLKSVTKFANTCDQLIAPSSSTKEFMRAHGITQPIEVIPTGLAHSYKSDRPKAELRAELDLPPDAFVMLCVSRISIADKNLLLLPRALKLVLHKIPKAILLIVGSGPDEAKLKAVIAEQGLTESARMIGPIQNQNLPRYYSAADVFTYPSVTETQGIITLEALSAGLPVVATRAPGTIDFVQDQHNGLLTHNDSIAFADAIVRVAQDHALYTKLAATASASVAPYTAQAVAKKLLAVYGQLLAGQRTGSQGSARL